MTCDLRLCRHPTCHPVRGVRSLFTSSESKERMALFSVAYVLARFCHFCARLSEAFESWTGRLGFLRCFLLWVLVFAVLALISPRSVLAVFFGAFFVLATLDFFASFSKEPRVVPWQTRTSSEEEIASGVRRYFPPVLAFMFVITVFNIIHDMWNFS